MAGAAPYSGTFCHTLEPARDQDSRRLLRSAGSPGRSAAICADPAAVGVRAGCCLPAAPMGGSRALGPLSLARAKRAARSSWAAGMACSRPGGEGRQPGSQDAVQARAGDAFHPVSRPDSQRRGGETQQGSLELLSDPVAKALLESVNPARLAYTWMDGSPRVVPIWFHWTGDQFVLGTPPKAPKLRALAADPRVALTIDDNQWPHKVLLVRGRASVGMLDDVSPEYKSSRPHGTSDRKEQGGGLAGRRRCKVYGPHRHHARLGRDTGLPDPVYQCPDAVGSAAALRENCSWQLMTGRGGAIGEAGEQSRSCARPGCDDGCR